ncbi:MAG: NAD(P)H-hydrate dehydratase [Herminiimonas sp.]|nr:NAD(P)H-hydrate dehydratase [Herminiimonas sp.]
MTLLYALYPIAEIREIERAATASLAPGTLMQRAGIAATAIAQDLIPDNIFSDDIQRVLVIAGPGNNGGDALEVAANLAEAGRDVTVLLYADEARQPPDAQRALARARASRLRFDDTFAPADALVAGSWALVVDGLFGIGLARAAEGHLQHLIDAVNQTDCPVLALDVPSGLDADTGNIVGEHGVAIRATHTATFIGDKPGLHTGVGRDFAGIVIVCDLDLAPTYFNEPVSFRNHIGLFAGSLRRRPHSSHKGSYGDVAVIGGAHGMAGAPVLAASAAAKSGAGRVFVGFLEKAPEYDSTHPELMMRLTQDLQLQDYTLVIGPGLGQSKKAHEVLTRAIAAATSMIIDADALNLLAEDRKLQDAVTTRTDGTIITPHPLEAARLLSCSVAQVQADRPAAARELARRFNAIAILKGSGTVIADPAGRIVINPTGNPALATAGTGDVLAGICGALLAQGWPQWRAALGAVWMHGKAADDLVSAGIGPIGLTASELVPVVRTIFNSMVVAHGGRQAG